MQVSTGYLSGQHPILSIYILGCFSSFLDVRYGVDNCLSQHHIYTYSILNFSHQADECISEWNIYIRSAHVIILKKAGIQRLFKKAYVYMNSDVYGTLGRIMSVLNAKTV